MSGYYNWVEYYDIKNNTPTTKTTIKGEDVKHGVWLWGGDGVRCSICNHKLETI